MTADHPNLSLIQRLNLRNLADSAELFSEDVVWHFFNPRLPDLQGDYIGLAGIETFFSRLATSTDGTFQVVPVSITAAGDELVVTHSKNRMEFENEPIEVDVVVVWRIVEGRINEVWDIPSIYSPRSLTGT